MTDTQRLTRVKALLQRRDCLSATDAMWLIDAIPWLLGLLAQPALAEVG